MPQKMDDEDPQKAGENVAQSGTRSGQSDWGASKDRSISPLASFTPSRPYSTNLLGLSRPGIADA
jgi:hypothetical protein